MGPYAREDDNDDDEGWNAEELERWPSGPWFWALERYWTKESGKVEDGEAGWAWGVGSAGSANGLIRRRGRNESGEDAHLRAHVCLGI